MRQYKIYKHPIGTTVAVKQGWSWPAFFFDALWSLIKKMSAFGIGILAAFLLLGFFLSLSGAGETGTDFILLISIVIKIIFGKYGNSWLSEKLKSRGYEHLDTVTAANPEGALALFLKDQNTAFKEEQNNVASQVNRTTHNNRLLEQEAQAPQKTNVKAAASTALAWALGLSAGFVLGPIFIGLVGGAGINGNLMAQKILTGIVLFPVLFIIIWLWEIFTKKEPTINKEAQSDNQTNKSSYD